MKKKHIIYSLILVTATVFLSCKVDEKYSPKTLAAGQLQFAVADGALTGTAFAGTTQPGMDVSAARFAKAAPVAPAVKPNYFGPGGAGVTGTAVVTANLSSELTSLTINIENTSTGARETKATFTGVSGSVTWTAPLSSLGFAGATPADNSTLTCEFIAASSDGSKMASRVFLITVIP